MNYVPKKSFAGDDFVYKLVLPPFVLLVLKSETASKEYNLAF